MLMLKIWPDGFVIEEDPESFEANYEANYGRSDDYFTIFLEETTFEEAAIICGKHFQAQLPSVLAEISEYYQ